MEDRQISISLGPDKDHLPLREKSFLLLPLRKLIRKSNESYVISHLLMLGLPSYLGNCKMRYFCNGLRKTKEMIGSMLLLSVPECISNQGITTELN